MTYLRLIAKRSVNSFQFEGNHLFINKFMIVVQSNCEKKIQCKKMQIIAFNLDSEILFYE